MSDIAYDRARQIRSVQVTAWLVKFPDGKERIEIWSKDATIDDVHSSLRRDHERFQMTAIGVGGGQFKLEGNDQLYLPDARYVDQDRMIQI